MFTDGSEESRKLRSRPVPLLLAMAASALASTGLAPVGLAQVNDLAWVSPSCGAAAAGVYGAVKWVKSGKYSVRLVVERKPGDDDSADSGPSVDIGARFERLLGEEDARRQNLAKIHASPDGTEDLTLMLVERLLAAPEAEWEDAEREIWTYAADRKTRPYHRVVIASVLAERDRAKAVTLLVQVARESELGFANRLMAIDELRRWDRGMSAVEYEYLSADEQLGPDDRIEAGERLGMLDTERGAAVLLSIVQNPKIEFDDRFSAAVRSGRFSHVECERALWALANDSFQTMTNRVSASGRLYQMGVPGAQELLESGAANLDIEPNARELCRKFLANSNRL